MRAAQKNDWRASGPRPHRCRRERRAEVQRRPLWRATFRPRAPAVAANDAMYDRQPDAGSRELSLCMHPLEDSKQLVRVLHVESNTVVPDEIHLFVLLPEGADFDARRITRSGEL